VAARNLKSRPGRRSRIRWQWLAVAATLIVAIVTADIVLFHIPAADHHLRTARGEQRTLELPDGSVLRLNTLSRAKVMYDEHVRRVELIEGEALFQVAKDSQRPFEVHTPDAVVRALGTTFNVYRRADGTRIAVVEGKVSLTSHDTRSAAARPGLALGPNQVARVETDGAVGVPRDVDAGQVTAWTQRRLIFDEEPLASVVAEFNRYSQRQLRIEDAALAQLHINGVFDADDPDALIAYLLRIQRVSVREGEANTRVLGRTEK
jgi:transmembrane sensor